jgi:folate-binding protein YgfZ
LSKGPVYAALLTPQGKYLSDFFLVARGESILLDVAPSLAESTIRRLTMYRLRADVGIAECAWGVARSLEPEEGGVADPRHPALGYRIYGEGVADGHEDWDGVRVAHCIPESGVELIPDESYILESGFERLHGVDFRKGCYVGQEVTARMKHKTELRKGLVTVAVSATVPIGTGITADGKAAGTVFTQSGGRAIAYLRFDRAGEAMEANGATVSWDGSQPV